MNRVVVIGGGLAGVSAALSAAGLGAEVLMISRSPGATAACPGGIDLTPSAGPPPCGHPEARTTLTENLERLLREEPGHPFGLASVDLEELCDGARFHMEHMVAAPLSWKGPDKPPFLLATEAGTIREMDMPPASCREGDLSRAEDMVVGVMGIVELPRFDPVHLAWSLGEFMGERGMFQAVGNLEVSDRGVELHPAVVAKLIEEQPDFPDRVAAQVAGMELTHIMFPPVLGFEGNPGIMARLKARTGLLPFEALAVTTTVPGVRMLDALHDMADSFGVERIQAMVEPGAAEGRTIRSVRLVDSLGGVTELQVDSVVLATGDWYGGGLFWGEEPVEAMFGLPVYPGGGYRGNPGPGLGPLPGVLGWDPRWESAAFSAGLRVGKDLRPLGRDQEPAFENLWACGAILAGQDPGARRGGTGVAMVTGRRAGALATGAKPEAMMDLGE